MPSKLLKKTLHNNPCENTAPDLSGTDSMNGIQCPNIKTKYKSQTEEILSNMHKIKNFYRKYSLLGIKMQNSNPNAVGILLVLISGIGFVGLGVSMRASMDMGYHSTQVAFLRGLGGAFLCLPVCYSLLKSSTLRDILPDNLWILLARGIFAGVALSLSTYALARISLAEFTSISFSMPILLTIAAVFFFNESVGIRRITAVIVGFVGVYLLLDPQNSGMSMGKWAALLFVLFATTAQILGKILSASTSITVIVLSATLGMTVVAGLLSIPYWQPLRADAYMMLAVMGILGHIGQWTFAKGIAVGEVSVIMPFDYARLLYSVVAGYLFFAEMPTGHLWAGSALIIGATLYTSMRERKLHRERTLQAKKQPLVK